LLFPLLAKSVQVRQASQEDAPMIARVQIASWRAAYRELVEAEVLEALDLEQRTRLWQRILRPGQGHTLVAAHADAVVGFCHLKVSSELGEEPSGEITATYVDPDWWHQGHGLKLMNEALREASRSGMRTVLVWVMRSNHGARAFYEALGFKADGNSKLSAFGRGPESEQVRYRLAVGR
jgi:GNAT superfamily N-acetyltransferase